MTTKSVALSILGVSTVGGVATGGYFFMKPSNIGELLISENIKLLDAKGNEEEWKKLVAKHNGQEVSITTKDNNTVKIKAISGLNDISTKDKDGIKELKEKCKDLLGKPITKGAEFETNKQAAKDWCSSDSTIFKEKTQTVAPQGLLTSSTTTTVTPSVSPGPASSPGIGG